MNKLCILILLLLILFIVITYNNKQTLVIDRISLDKIAERYPKNGIVKFHSRTNDRYGAIVMPLVKILLSNHHNNNVGLFDIKKGKDPSGNQIDFSDSIMFKNILKFPNTKLYQKGDKYDVDIGISNFFDEGSEAVALYKKDLISIVKDEGFKEKWYQTYYEKALKEGWNLPTQLPYIAIHYRADDMKNTANVVDGEKQQHTLSNTHSNILLEYLQNKYPQLPIYIITTQPDFPHIEEILKQINKRHMVKAIIGSESHEYDKDLWYMMNSEILVITSSIYPLIAGMLHQGKRVYITNPHTYYLSLGLFSNFDRSGWVRFNF